jgi:energy-coupling factor transporter ATP-binding protein EcfA2
MQQAGGQPAAPMLTSSGPIRLLSNTTLNTVQQPGTPGMSTGPIAETTYNTQPRMSQAIGLTPMSANLSFEHSRRTVLAPFDAALDAALGVPRLSIVRGDEDAWRLGVDELSRRSGGEANIEQLAAVFEQASQAIADPPDQPYSSLRPLPNPRDVLRPAAMVANKLGVSILSVTEQQIVEFQPWGTDQFNFDLATLFGRYRDRYLRNRLQQLTDNERGTNKAFSPEDFVRVFGRAPWISLNETFANFGINYEVITPELDDYAPVAFGLRKVEGGEQVHPSNLSSGERVLLQFAISSYQHDDGMTNIQRPELLLLDELDAPLHPKMVHRWLGAISNGLVEAQGIHCILTTHSPTTVALAPEEALYEMRDGQSGLVKISKQEALNKLTFGVPTLSIDYSGRRQVFAESDTDAAIYERMYAIIKSDISCERELNFLSTGMRNKDGGEINSGCIVVKNIVRQMTSFGARNVFGIVDWDGETASTDRVKVVAEGLRDGIENVLLDPLLICLLLMKLREAPQGLHDINRFTGADALDALSLQRLADAVQHEVFPTAKAKTEVHYLGGARVEVLDEYLSIDDHNLETALTKAFPVLNKWARNRGALVKAVIEEVLTEHRGFSPSEIGTIFETIANAPA